CWWIEKKAAAQTSRNGATKSSRSSPGLILPGTSNLSSANKATLGILGRERFYSGNWGDTLYRSIKASDKISYLDNNATTAIDPAVLEAMRPYLEKYFANPS